MMRKETTKVWTRDATLTPRMLIQEMMIAVTVPTSAQVRYTSKSAIVHSLTNSRFGKR